MAYCCTGHHVNSDDALWCTACGSLVEGAMIGDYRLVSYVGNGSAADVYLAEQSSLSKRRVVIKIMHRSWSASRIGHFEREAAVLAALSHPYILPIFPMACSTNERRRRGNRQRRTRGSLHLPPTVHCPYSACRISYCH